VYELTTPTAIGPTELVISFEQGLPVGIDGKRLPLSEVIAEVDRIVGSYGWGRIDMVENRRVGIKSREVYECPGALALLMAHADLEDLTLERDLAHEKARLEPRYAELVYDGLWFSPLKQALDAFVDKSQEYVTGDVRLRCELPGRCIVAGRRSEVGLYDYSLATYEAADRFRHQDAEGFVRLWGLGVATWAARQVNRPPVGRSDGQP
jgi:argininosuccinate synthase